MALALTWKALQEAAYGLQFAHWFVTPFLGILPYIYQARFSRAGNKERKRSAAGRYDQYIAFIAIGACLWDWVTNLL